MHKVPIHVNDIVETSLRYLNTYPNHKIAIHSHKAQTGKQPGWYNDQISDDTAVWLVDAEAGKQDIVLRMHAGGLKEYAKHTHLLASFCIGRNRPILYIASVELPPFIAIIMYWNEAQQGSMRRLSERFLGLVSITDLSTFNLGFCR